MRFHFAPEQNYDCVQCGRSCQAGWDIPVEEAVQERIRDHVLTLRVIQERGAALRDKKPLPVLNMTPQNPRCGYLEPDLLCGLHKHIGVHAKPNTCRLYPYIITQTPDGYFIGVAYSCTGARENAGRHLSLHESDLKALIQDGTTLNVVANDGLVVHGPWFTRWTDYLSFESELVQRARDGGYANTLSRAARGLAGALAEFPKPRTPSPRPLPEDTLARAFSSGEPLDSSVSSNLLLDILAELEGEHVRSFAAGSAPLRVGKWEGGLGDWRELLNRPLPSAFQAEMERYLDHLVFRKQLVIHPTLLSNLVLAATLPSFLSFYTYALAGNTEPAKEHYWEALDLAEKYLVYHCRGLRSTYQKAARQAVERLKPVTGGT